MAVIETVGPANHRVTGRRPAAAACSGPHRPRPRPAAPAVRYRGTGVLRSQTSHRPRPITPLTTAVLALVAAAITVWLGLIAHLGAASTDAAAPVPDKLGVVQVHAGESLQHVAARVAPGAPTAQVADRIRELNQLDSVALDAGQTLIAPIG